MDHQQQVQVSSLDLSVIKSQDLQFAFLNFINTPWWSNFSIPVVILT
jgi:hypothetical protein